MLIHTQQGEPENALLEAALTYARHGWFCFPCKRGKDPFIKTGFHAASTDPDQIREWWRQYPRAEIGIACGASGLVVLDYDQQKDPTLAGAELIAELVDGTHTRMARTGHGGAHYYFRARPDALIRNSDGDLGPGVDTRGDGGYVLAPPSRNDGGAYSWLNRAALEPVPDALIERYREVKKSKTAGSVTDPGTGVIPEGRRNGTLASLAGTLQRRGVSPLAIEAALLAENAEHCAPPLPDEEVRKIAGSITAKYPVSAPITEPIPASSEPDVELLATDAVRIRLTLADGVGGSFTFTEMEKERRELAAHLSLAFFGSGEPYQQRVNLESSSQRTELRRELDNLYGKDHGWARALNTVWSLARNTFLGQDRSICLRDIPPVIGRSDLISPVMPSEGTTILFGDGGSLKSYIALGLALASQTAQPFAARYKAPPTTVLYIDYEDSEPTFRDRSERLLGGAGLPKEAGDLIRYWDGGGIALRSQWKAIKQTCDQHNVGWIVLDSAAVACDGPAQDQVVASALFNALKSIGRPCLLIAHVVKGEGREATQKPFGSAYWHNLARRTWFVARSQHEEADDAHLALYCRKANDGDWPRPLGFQVTFAPDKGPVSFTTASVSGDFDLTRHDSLQNQIFGVLTHPMTAPAIAELVDASGDVVSATLRRQKERFVQCGTEPANGRGQPARLWARLAHSDEAPF